MEVYSDKQTISRSGSHIEKYAFHVCVEAESQPRTSSIYMQVMSVFLFSCSHFGR